MNAITHPCFSQNSSCYDFRFNWRNAISVNQSSKVDKPKTCFSLMEESFPIECSPYKVFVAAHNQVGFSNTSNVTLQGIIRFYFLCRNINTPHPIIEGNEDICSCMEHKCE